jgi:sigma-B regulation protein RsbU (phosphoserine phosphatase)
MLDKQRIEEEINLAREIQKNLLPHHFPSGDRYELAGYNLPSKEVGGDYYDFIPIDERKIGIAIGDIVGKGIPAAILMSNLQAALRISASQAITTQDVMRQVNIQITRTTTVEKFATFFYGVFDTEKFSFEYSNAGHNFPILWRNHGVYNLLRKGGIVIGVMENALYESELISMSPGDFLVMYTDGITEALNPLEEEFGEQRLLQTIENVSHKSAQDILDSIIDAVSNFTHNYLQFDDLTLVVLKIK